MNREVIIPRVEQFVRNSLSLHDSGHDWWHIDRVRKLALRIQQQENTGDRLIIELAALLHDLDDKKFTGRDEKGTDNKIRSLLSEQDTDAGIADMVIMINRNISFSSGNSSGVTGAEFMIVQDADRIDALGAVGIARAFNYGGFRNNIIYDPEGSRPSTIGHFYDKLLKLKDMMNTESGRKMALERHRFMEEFLERFYLEWESGQEQ